MIYQINTAIQEQDLNRKSFKFENHFYNRRKHIMKQLFILFPIPTGTESGISLLKNTE